MNLLKTEGAECHYNTVTVYNCNSNVLRN